MKILFIVEMDGSMKGGLFLTTHDKIKTLLDEYKGISADVYCISVYDGKLLAFVKRVFRRSVRVRQEPEYEYQSIKYTSLYVKETITRKILKKIGYDFLYYKQPVDQVECDRYDLVSAHWGDPQGSMANYLKKKHDLPYSLALYGSDVHSIRSNGRKKLIVRNMNEADAVFFVSPQLRSQAENIGFKDLYDRSHIINNAVNLNIFRPYSEPVRRSMKDKMDTHSHVVGFAGNLNYVKRADCLVDMFKEIQLQAANKITFFIIGDGPLKSDIQKDADQSGLDIRLIGNIPQEELADYYNVMDCGILASRNEGYGNVVSESQACGTPVIAANIGGIPEAVADMSYLVSMDNDGFINEFAKKVNFILAEGIRVQVKSKKWKEIVHQELQVWRRFAAPSVNRSFDQHTASLQSGKSNK